MSRPAAAAAAAAALARLALALLALALLAAAPASAAKMDNLPLPSGPRTTIEVNPWTTGQKFPPIDARCGDAVVFTWTPSETHGVVRLIATPSKKNGTLTCPCPAVVGNGTSGPEALLLAPSTKGGSYRYIVINETEPFCITSQAQGDCKKGQVQVIRPTCPLAPPSASAAGGRASASSLVATAAAVVAGAIMMAVVA